jgi:hypothetical protein
VIYRTNCSTADGYAVPVYCCDINQVQLLSVYCVVIIKLPETVLPPVTLCVYFTSQVTFVCFLPVYNDVIRRVVPPMLISALLGTTVANLTET